MTRTSYRVVGGNRVLGHTPGTTFLADLKPDQEARLIKAGHLEKTPVKRAERTTTARKE